MAKNTIVLKDYTKARYEFVADDILKPGICVTLDSAGEVTLNNPVGHMVVLENELEGQDIDDAYAVGDIVQVGMFREGDELYMVQNLNETTAIGAVIGPKSDGTGLGAFASNAAFLALEAVTTTSSFAFIKVMVISGVSS